MQMNDNFTKIRRFLPFSKDFSRKMFRYIHTASNFGRIRAMDLVQNTNWGPYSYRRPTRANLAFFPADGGLLFGCYWSIETNLHTDICSYACKASCYLVSLWLTNCSSNGTLPRESAKLAPPEPASCVLSVTEKRLDVPTQCKIASTFLASIFRWVSKKQNIKANLE